MSRTRNIVAALAGCALAVMAGAADRPPVRVVKNIAYLANAHYADNKDKLDLYLPERAADGARAPSGLPVIVSFYGGALEAGDKNEQAFVGQRFAAAGIVTAVVNYRLSPGVTHPAHIQDAAASFAWVKRHVAEYGGNPDQVFVIGHSAGAYLAALLATDERYLAAQKLSLRDIRGVVPVSAFYWVERAGVAPDRDTRVWGTDEKVWVDASPAHHLHAGLPPMLILFADGDEAWRRRQNMEVAKAIGEAGNDNATVAMIQYRDHNSIWGRIGGEGDPVADRIIRFVRDTTATSAAR
jgi:acetyl esterase/lipase